LVLARLREVSQLTLKLGVWIGASRLHLVSLREVEEAGFPALWFSAISPARVLAWVRVWGCRKPAWFTRFPA